MSEIVSPIEANSFVSINAPIAALCAVARFHQLKPAAAHQDESHKEVMKGHQSTEAVWKHLPVFAQQLLGSN